MLALLLQMSLAFAEPKTKAKPIQPVEKVKPAKATAVTPAKTADGKFKVPVRKLGPEKYAVRRNDALEYATQPRVNAKDARVEKALKNGELEGYRLAEMDDDSVFARLGFKVGDILLQINEYSVAEPMAVPAIIAAVALETEFKVHYRRGGKPKFTTLILEE